MIGDYGNQGTNALGLREIVWLDNTPIAIVHVVNGNHSATAGDFAYIHSDHLNTPRALVRGTGAAVGATIWTWQLRLDPFGETLPNQDPDADGLQYAFNLRFPGQHFDNETGLHYNYFRDYEPGTGRYVQSDPIGLSGGTGTYAYVDSNSLGRRDPLGLWWKQGLTDPGYDWGECLANGGDINSCRGSLIAEADEELTFSMINYCETTVPFIKCNTICVLNTVVGESLGELFGNVTKQGGLAALRKSGDNVAALFAKEVAKKHARKLAPIIGAIDLMNDFYKTGVCSTDCALGLRK